MFNLSSRSYALLSLITATAIAGLWLDLVPADLWRLLISLWVIAVYLEWRQQRSAYPQLQQQHDTKVVLGDALSIHYQPDSDLFQAIRAMPCYPAHWSAPQPLLNWQAKQQQTQSVSLHAIALGKVDIGSLYVQYLGRFGLVWWSQNQVAKQPIDIIPAYQTYTQQAYSQQQATAQRQHKRIGQGRELHTLRGYQSGDSLRHIDWKASARSGQRQVRIYSEEQQLNLILLMDCGQQSQLQAGRLSRLHQHINQAARLSATAVQQGDAVALLSFAQSPIAYTGLGQSRQHIQAIRQQLSQLSSQPEDSDYLAAVMYLQQTTRKRALIVLFTDISRTDSQQLQQAMRLLRPKHIPIIASLSDPDINRLSQYSAQQPLDPYYQYAAQQEQQHKQQIQQQLQKLGVTSLIDSPENLGERILQTYQRLRHGFAKPS